MNSSFQKIHRALSRRQALYCPPRSAWHATKFISGAFSTRPKWINTGFYNNDSSQAACGRPDEACWHRCYRFQFNCRTLSQNQDKLMARLHTPSNALSLL